MLNQRHENILIGYMYLEEIFSEYFSKNIINDVLLEATACKIVEDCHQVVEKKANTYFSSLYDNIPELTTRILNKKLPFEAVLEPIIGTMLESMLYDISHNVLNKADAAEFLRDGKSSETLLISKLPSVETFKSDINFIVESYEISRNISEIGMKLCQTILDKIIPNICRFFFTANSVSALIWEHLNVAGRENNLSNEIEKRLKGLFDNLKLRLVNSINDSVSEFVFQRCDEMLHEKFEKDKQQDKLALTA